MRMLHRTPGCRPVLAQHCTDTQSYKAIALCLVMIITTIPDGSGGWAGSCLTALPVQHGIPQPNRQLALCALCCSCLLPRSWAGLGSLPQRSTLLWPQPPQLGRPGLCLQRKATITCLVLCAVCSGCMATMPAGNLHRWAVRLDDASQLVLCALTIA